MDTLKVQIVNKSQNDAPNYAKPGDAGMDLRSNEEVIIPSLGRALVKTGLFMAIPAGHEGQVRPRSGAAIKQGLTVLNAPGTVDSGYRGEVGVILFNASAEEITIEVGDRVAQMVFAAHDTATVELVDELDETERGAGGFGSTGK